MSLDPDAETLLAMMRAAGRPPMETLSPDAAREQFKAGRAVTQPDPQEVADTFEVPVSHVFAPQNHRSGRRALGEHEVRVWDIQYEGHNIWGATAGMLLNLYRLCVTHDAKMIAELAGSRNEPAR